MPPGCEPPRGTGTSSCLSSLARYPSAFIPGLRTARTFVNASAARVLELAIAEAETTYQWRVRAITQAVYQQRHQAQHLPGITGGTRR